MIELNIILYSGLIQEQMEQLAKPPVEAPKLLHGLKGSSANMAMPRLAERCQQLEKQSLRPADIESLSALWCESLTEFERCLFS